MRIAVKSQKNTTRKSWFNVAECVLVVVNFTVHWKRKLYKIMLGFFSSIKQTSHLISVEKWKSRQFAKKEWIYIFFFPQLFNVAWTTTAFCLMKSMNKSFVDEKIQWIFDIWRSAALIKWKTSTENQKSHLQIFWVVWAQLLLQAGF